MGEWAPGVALVESVPPPYLIFLPLSQGFRDVPCPVLPFPPDVLPFPPVVSLSDHFVSLLFGAHLSSLNAGRIRPQTSPGTWLTVSLLPLLRIPV